jgi:hypothetical protein
MLPLLCPTVVANGAHPPRGFEVGSEVIVNITYVVDPHFSGITCLRGFRNVDGAHVATTAAMTAHSALVVDGIAPKLVLLSVRKLRELERVLLRGTAIVLVPQSPPPPLPMPATANLFPSRRNRCRRHSRSRRTRRPLPCPEGCPPLLAG